MFRIPYSEGTLSLQTSLAHAEKFNPYAQKDELCAFLRSRGIKQINLLDLEFNFTFESKDGFHCDISVGGLENISELRSSGSGAQFQMSDIPMPNHNEDHLISDNYDQFNDEYVDELRQEKFVKTFLKNLEASRLRIMTALQRRRKVISGGPGLQAGRIFVQVLSQLLRNILSFNQGVIRKLLRRLNFVNTLSCY